MSIKVNSSPLNLSTQLGGQSTSVALPPLVGSPMDVLLFGKQRARRLEERKYPKLKKALRKLRAVKGQIAEIMGQADEAFEVELTEGGNASISQDGDIGVGKDLLEEREDDDDFWVAVLGHEIGHRPWTWKKLNLRGLNKKQLDALYREEEAKADRFAGRVLADLGADPESVCQFLIAHEKFEGHAPSDYYPAQVRAQMIYEAFKRRDQMLRRGTAVLGDAGSRRLRDLR